MMTHLQTTAFIVGLLIIPAATPINAETLPCLTLGAGAYLQGPATMRNANGKIVFNLLPGATVRVADWSSGALSVQCRGHVYSTKRNALAETNARPHAYAGAYLHGPNRGP